MSLVIQNRRGEMALFNVSVWQRSRFTLQWFIINLVGSLACLTAVALAQFEWSERVSGSVSIPDVAFTWLGNLAVFMTAFTRGRLDVENGARDVLATTRGPKLEGFEGFGLTTPRWNDLRDVDVVPLSKYNERPHSSLTQFMQYVSHSHDLDSILLQFLPLISSPVTAAICECGYCECVVFWATAGIMVMLAHRLPGTLKRLSESQCLLPSLSCLKKGCHGCNLALLYVKDLPDEEAAGESSELVTFEGRLREDNPMVDSPAAVCEALAEFVREEKESSCICIPVHPGNADRWTKFMIKFLKSKENEAKGIKVVVSDALQHYITDSAQELVLLPHSPTGCIVASEKYDGASLILPRVAEVIVNMGLTGWLKVDGFSSSLVARRAIRDHVVDSAGTGFGANAFLTEAAVLCSGDGTNVCQVLWFRGGILSARRVSYMVGCVNLICSITWSVLIACEGNWAPSVPLSTPIVSVIIGAVGVALGMDCFEVYGGQVRAQLWARARSEVRAQLWARAVLMDPDLLSARTRAQARAEAQAPVRDQAWASVRASARARARIWDWARAQAGKPIWAWDEDQDQARAQVWWLVAVVILEIGCIASLVVRLSMNKGVGRWVYSSMQVLVWVKWGIGSFLLGDNASENEDASPLISWIRKRGTWVYCSAFLLNAMLAGVRGKWVYSI